MPRNERQTCADLIEPALQRAGWQWRRKVVIGPGRVSLAGDRMYDASQRVVADYVLSHWCMPLVVLEAKAEGTAAVGALLQGERYARRLGVRFVLASNGSEWVLLDTASGTHEAMAAPPEPGHLLARAGIVLPDAWRAAFEHPWHEDLITRKNVRPYQECAICLVRGNGSRHLVGRSALAEHDREDVVFGDLLIRLRFRPRVLPEFANLALHSRSCREQIQSLAKTAAGIWKVNHGAVGAIRIPTPALDVQHAAVERVTELRQTTAQMLTEMRAESAESLAAKVLEAAFAGKL